MRLIWITAALCVALTAPAFGLDYDCSPLTGACVPTSPPPPSYDRPSVYIKPAYPAQRVWPRTCPLDGPGAWECTSRERERRDKGDKR
jgi:hypothetical protein